MTRAELSPLRRHIEESPKLRELRNKRSVKRRRLAILLSVLFLTIVGGLITVAHYPQLQLVNVVVSGNKIVDGEEIVTEVQKSLAGNYYYVIPHRNAFFYPKGRIIADLMTEFPRFKNVTVYRVNVTTLLVTVTEVRGRALWCGIDTTAPDMSAPCYFTDEAGKIVAPAPYYSGNVYPRFFGGVLLPNDVNALGKTFTTEIQFQNLLKFSDQVTRLGLPVEAIVVGRSGENSFLIDLGGGATAAVRFLSSDDYQTLESNLAAALTKDALISALKKDKSNLLYFDLRFTNKVYYKFSDQ